MQFEGPTVIVFYCNDPAQIVAGFKEHGYKIAGPYSLIHHLFSSNLFLKNFSISIQIVFKDSYH